MYQYKDHLGNIRLSYKDNNGNLEIVEENNYYPFGLKMRGFNENVSPNGNSTAQKYKFNQREWQDELGLNMTAMDFRQYDNALGRFVVTDRMSELAPGINPYRFAFNNPIAYADPTGLREKKKDGSWHTDDKKDIERFMDMLAIEQENNGGVSGAQVDLFIQEEFQGSGGRLSDGSALLDDVTLKADRQGNINSFLPYQVGKISSQIERFVSNPYNEKSFGFGSYWYGQEHWAYSYKYFRETNYYANGGQGFNGASLGGSVNAIVSDFIHNNKFWMGKNLKFYDVSWGGNRFTGGRNKFAKKWSGVIGKGGTALSLVSLYSTHQSYDSGKLNAIGASYLGASEGVGLRNVCGAAWSLGTSLGQWIVESKWYFDKVYKDYN